MCPLHVVAICISGSTDISVGQGDSKTGTKINNSEGSGMETDQEEQMDALLN